MRIEFVEDQRLPQLGFVGSVRGSVCELSHGTRVERTERFFTDGAWAGDFSDGPQTDQFMVGSAGVAGESALVLLTSSAPIDRMFAHEPADGGVVFSNSLPSILSALSDELDPAEIHYRSLFMAAEVGVRSAPRHFLTHGGRTLRILMNEVATIQGGRVTYRSRPAHREFRSYHDYRNELSATSKLLMLNSADPARTRPFGPLASLSVGYDSCVVAVMMAEAGFTDAVTLLRYSDETETSLIDHPGTVADVLGLQLEGVRRDTWRTRTDLVEATIAASGTTFMDVVMLAYDDILEGKLLVVGHSGDSIWSTGNFRAYNDIVQGVGQISGRGLAEHRLERGYVMFPIPFIGMTAQPSVLRITNSDDMAPWRLGGSYDRPIARRIVEEAGVPRGSFALRKWAGSARVGSSTSRYSGTDRSGRLAEMTEVMSPHAAGAFLDFVNKTEQTMNSGEIRRVRRSIRVDRIAATSYEKIDALNFRIGRRLHRFRIRGLIPRLAMQRLAARAKLYPDYTYLLPHWGNSVMVDRMSGWKEEGSDANP